MTAEVHDLTNNRINKIAEVQQAHGRRLDAIVAFLEDMKDMLFKIDSKLNRLDRKVSDLTNESGE